MKAYETPIFWSVSKLFPGLLVRILEERGELDVSLPIEVYLKRLSTSAFAGVMVRNLLHMASGLDCGDEYQLQNSCYYQYSIAIGDGFWHEGGARDPYVYLATLNVERIQGQVFSYCGVNTFIWPGWWRRLLA